MSPPRWLPGLIAIAALAQLCFAANSIAAGPIGDRSIGAVVPWITYEAEQAQTSGTVIGPDYTGRSATREASGRQCVQLATNNAFIDFTAKAPANAIVVRYSIGDPADGRANDATLSLSINSKPAGKLQLTSRYCYLYGDYPFSNNPAAGNPRRFWDEARIMPGNIKAGDVIRLQKDADDHAPPYLIDFIDLESVPPPLARPANSLSIADFGAVANGDADAHAAFESAIAAARAAHKSVWIPPGNFVVKGNLRVSDVSISGAGMWHSTLIGCEDYSPENRLSIEGAGSNITLADFAIIGKLNYRSDKEANDGIGGSFGTGSVIRNLWVEHTKTGAWLVNSDGLLVEGCRFRNTIADGLNLCVGMRNTLVRNCSARGTGDDCFAMWPATYNPAAYTAGNNRFDHCTAQLPFLAQAFSVYGGDNNRVENCLAVDIPYGAGALASTMFKTDFGFRGVTKFENIRMLRAGDRDGAIAVMTNLRPLAGVRFQNIDVIDSPTDGIRFTCVKGLPITDAAFDHIRIVNPGISGSGSGIVEASGAAGSAALNDVSIVIRQHNLDIAADKLDIKEHSPSGADLATAQRSLAGQ